MGDRCGCRGGGDVNDGTLDRVGCLVVAVGAADDELNLIGRVCVRPRFVGEDGDQTGIVD